jgi:hypothetical protein
MEQAEQEYLTFHPSLATSNRPRSPSPQRNRAGQECLNSSIDVSHSNVDSTPLKPKYNLGSSTETEQPNESPVSPKVLSISFRRLIIP